MSETNNIPIEPNDDLLVEIDALGVANPATAIMPAFALERLNAVRTAVALNAICDDLKEGGIQPAVSLWTGGVFDPRVMRAHLNPEIPITSLDAPFVLTPLDMAREFSRNMTQDGVVGASLATAFSLTCVMSRSEMNRRLEAARRVVSSGYEPKLRMAPVVIRGSSGHFAQGREQQGEVLLNLLRQDPKTVLTLEQDEKLQSWNAYMALFDYLNSQFPGRIFISLDVAHLMAGRKLYPQFEQPTGPEAIERVGTHMAALEVGTHTAAVRGETDVPDFELLAKLYREQFIRGKLPLAPRLIIEAVPPKMREPGVIQIAKETARAFNKG